MHKPDSTRELGQFALRIYRSHAKRFFHACEALTPRERREVIGNSTELYNLHFDGKRFVDQEVTYNLKSGGIWNDSES